MMKENVASWVVYQMAIGSKAEGMRAVCLQSEWDDMERARPGYHTLLRSGIANEGQAERIARELVAVRPPAQAEVTPPQPVESGGISK